MSTTTKNDYIKNVKSFLEWTALNDFTLSGINDVLKPFAKTKTDDSSGYLPFSAEQVIKIFSDDIYQRKRYKPEHVWKYWIPLISIFTGARVNEISQLDTDDIRESNGIYYISINEESDDDDKSVKTNSSIRDVSIHDKLIELGFIDYAKKQRRHKHKKLFHTLNYDKSKDTYGSSVSKWFERHLHKIGIKTKNDAYKLVFHSFRKTFVNYFYQNESKFSEHHIGDVISHQNSKQITFGTYADKLDLVNMKKIIDAYNIDIGL